MVLLRRIRGCGKPLALCGGRKTACGHSPVIAISEIAKTVCLDSVNHANNLFYKFQYIIQLQFQMQMSMCVTFLPTIFVELDSIAGCVVDSYLYSLRRPPRFAWFTLLLFSGTLAALLRCNTLRIG